MGKTDGADISSSERRRGKVLPEHADEARRLKNIWLSKKPSLAEKGYGTQETFGARFGIGNQAAVGHFLNGTTALSPKAAAAFARGLEVPIEDFSPRLAELLASADPWPFPGIDRDRFDSLSQEQRLELQGAVRSALAAIEADSGNRNRSTAVVPSMKSARSFRT